MRIVHLLGWYFPDSVGGTEVYVEALCRRLRASGHEAFVAAPTVRDDIARDYLHDGVRVFRYRIAADATRDEAQGRVPVRGANAFAEWLAGLKPDLVHVHSFTTGIGLPEIRAARRLGVRVIATCHLPGLGYMCRTGELMQWGRDACDGIVIPEKCAACALTRIGMPRPLAAAVAAIPIALSGVFGRLPGKLGTTLGMPASIDDYADMQRELFTLVDRFVVLNEAAARMLVLNGSPSEKIALNRLGVSQRAAAKPGPDVRPTRAPVRFGYLGRLQPTKGLVELASAVQRIPADVSFELEIRGPEPDGATRGFVERLRSMSRGDTRVTFAGAVEPCEAPRALAAYDAIVCPSIWFENGPTVALEANAAGTPVIASRVGNLAEIIADGVNGRLVRPGDVHELSRALEQAARNPAATIDVWRRHIAAPRTMDDVARDYLALYEAA